VTRPTGPSSTPPEDDPSIADDDVLYRRVHPKQVKWDEAGVLAVRAGSGEFEDSEDGTGCSVAIKSVMEQHGLGISDLLRGYESEQGLAEFFARDARAVGFGVIHKPLASDPAHGELTGPKPPSARKRLAKATRIVVQPPRNRIG